MTEYEKLHALLERLWYPMSGSLIQPDYASMIDQIYTSEWLKQHDRDEREAIALFFDRVDKRMGNAIRFLKFNHQLTEDDLRRAHEIRKIIDEEKSDG